MFNAWLTVRYTVVYATEREVNCYHVSNSPGNYFSDSLLGSWQLQGEIDTQILQVSIVSGKVGGAWRPLSLAVISSVTHTHIHTPVKLLWLITLL